MNLLYFFLQQSELVETFDPLKEETTNSIHLIPVSNKNYLSGLTFLRNEIERISRNKTLCPNISHQIPESWLHLEQLCQSYKESNKKTITRDELWQDALKKKMFETKREMMAALEYIVLVSPILHFQKIHTISNIVFLDINWLFSTFKLIFRHDSAKFFEFKKEYKQTDLLSFRQHKNVLLNSGEMHESFLR